LLLERHLLHKCGNLLQAHGLSPQSKSHEMLLKSSSYHGGHHTPLQNSRTTADFSSHRIDSSLCDLYDQGNPTGSVEYISNTLGPYLCQRPRSRPAIFSTPSCRSSIPRLGSISWTSDWSTQFMSQARRQPSK